MSREYFSQTADSGRVAASGTSQTVVVNATGDDKWPVIYLKNLDGTDSIAVAIGADDSVTATDNATTQWVNQLVILPGEEMRVALHDIRFIAVIAADGAVGAPVLRWRMGLD